MTLCFLLLTLTLTTYKPPHEMSPEANKLEDNLLFQVTEAMAGLNNKSNSFSMESDWWELTYYTSRVMDLMMSSQGSAGGDADPLMAALGMSGVLAEGPWTLVMNSNLSQVGVAIGMAMNRMQNLTEGDLNE